MNQHRLVLQVYMYVTIIIIVHLYSTHIHYLPEVLYKKFTLKNNLEN